MCRCWRVRGASAVDVPARGSGARPAPLAKCRYPWAARRCSPRRWVAHPQLMACREPRDYLTTGETENSQWRQNIFFSLLWYHILFIFLLWGVWYPNGDECVTAYFEYVVIFIFKVILLSVWVARYTERSYFSMKECRVATILSYPVFHLDY